MAIGDVKITDLTQAMSAETTDLFLLARPLINSEGAFEDTPYSNYSVSGDALFDSAGESIRKKPLNITGKWNFQGGKNNSPTQNLKIQVGHFVEYGLENPDHLTSILSDYVDGGWYKGLSSSVMQDTSHRSGPEQSLSVTNDTIPNIDFVQRLVAYAYASLQEQLTAIANGLFIPSRIGQIVISTKLSTASGYGTNSTPSEDNIRKYYGYGQVVNGIQYPDTEWKQHIRYFLRGNNTGVIFNHPEKDDGEDSVKMTNEMMIAHNHGISKSNANLTVSYSNPSVSVSVPGGKFAAPKSGNGAGTSGGKSATFNGTVNNSVACSVTVSGGSASISYKDNSVTDTSGYEPSNITPIPTIPKYKNVYIWERIA